MILLDTDVFSFLARKGDTRADAYRKHIENKTVAISFISAGELYHWVLRHGLGSPKARELELKLDSVFVIPFDLGICRAYAEIKHQAKNESGSDRVVAANDLWIAACARWHSLPLVSNNRRHFENLPGVTLITEAPEPNR